MGLSPVFELDRGTRQGCPLSLLLFALARESLATHIRADDVIVGFRFGSRQKRIILYADNMLLLLGDSGHSLRKVMHAIQYYGKYFGH